MDAHELILKRRTIRKFEQRRIDKCILEGCVEAARLAPSAMNLQPLEYVIVDGKKTLERVFACTLWAGYEREAGPKRGEEPVAYVIILSDKRVSDAKMDVGLAAENIMLSALNAGVASCPLGAIDREKLSKVLGVPSTHAVELAIALGYPKQRSVAEDSEERKYWLDGKGVLHIPKRPLKKIMHKEKF